MKHTKKRLLALALVMAMVFGMMPMMALSVGAEGTTVADIAVGDAGSATNLTWEPAYVASPDAGADAWKVVETDWEDAFRLSNIFNVPKAGTTLAWMDMIPSSPGTLPTDWFTLTSWKQVGEEWVIDYAGTNLSFGMADTVNQRVVDTGVVIYTYTTTKDNEVLRLGCLGIGIGEEDVANLSVAVAAPSMEEGVIDMTGLSLPGLIGPTVTGVGGLVNGSAENIYSIPVMIPAAGTTVTATGKVNAEAFAISSWRAAGDGRPEMIYGVAGDGSADGAYSYTTAFDNELLVFCFAADADQPVVTYVEDNADVLPAALVAAGYDPALPGALRSLNWYNGVISVENEGLVLGGEVYMFSDILPVYGAGTTITFFDVMGDAAAGVGNFAGNDVFTVAKFDGTGYTGEVDAADIVTMTAGVVTGGDREAAVAAGKAVYTYTTTEEVEYLRFSVSAVGNTVDGKFVSPIIYMSTPDEGEYYTALEGLNIVSVGANSVWDPTGYTMVAGDHWITQLAGRYGMKYANFAEGINMAAMADADILMMHTVLPEEDTEAALRSFANLFPETLIVFVCYSAEEAALINGLNDDHLYAISLTFGENMPVDFFARYAAGMMGLNAAGHALVLSWVESLIAEKYADFGSLIDADGNGGVQFKAEGEVVASVGTASGDRDFHTPADTGFGMFGWVGTLKVGETETVKIFPADADVVLPAGSSGVFEPLTLAMLQVEGAELRLNDAPGLRFTAQLWEEDYKNILEMIAAGELGENAAVTVGMLIVPYEYVVEMDGVLTHAALAAAGKESVDVVSVIEDDGEGNLQWYDYEDGVATIAGSLTQILNENHAKLFTAAGYVKLTVGGEDFYVYAYNGGKTGANIYDGAIAALNDCRFGPNDDYPYAFTNQENKTYYSPYTNEERAQLGEFVKDVIVLETAVDPYFGTTTAVLKEYEFYDPNYNRDMFPMPIVNGGSDTLSDIFGGSIGMSNDYATVDDETWAELTAMLGSDEITSVCLLAALPGYEVTADGGIMLDGFACEIGNPDATVKCVEFVYEDVAYYLLGFSDYSVFY